MLQKDYRGMYTIDNTVISATHTHASAGGYLQYMLYSLTSLGFVSEVFDVLKHGIMEVRYSTYCCQPLDSLWGR